MKKIIETLIDKCIEKTKLINIFSIGLVVVGLWALSNTKRDLHPLFKFNTVVLSLSYPSGSASEIERLITYPIEESLRDLPDVEQMSSSSEVGFARIILKFPMSVKDLDAKMNEIRSKIQPVLRLLPPQVRDISVERAGDSKIFLASISIKGIDEKNWTHHRVLHSLQSRLRSVGGVVDVEASLRPFHVFIRFDQRKLESTGVSLLQMRSIVQSHIDSRVIGYNSVNGQDWLLEFEDKALDIKDIQNLPVQVNSTGQRLLLKDVADVRFDIEQNGKYQFLLNGEKAVEVTVFKSDTRDAMEAFADLKKTLEQVQLPEGITTEILYDGPYFIQQQIDVLLANGIGGLFLVLVMLGLAMGWKTSLMTAIGLPISYFGTFIVLKLAGVNIDLISMIAMILVVGNLVDDAVIFAERYNQLLSEGMDPKLAASTASKELIVPVSGTIATIICAFLPIVILDSELSVVFMAIPIVVATALALSWLETFFILPNHLQHYVRKPAGEKGVAFFHWMARGYKWILRHILRWRYAYGALSVALLVFSLIAASKMPQDFMLSVNAPQVEVFVVFNEDYDFDTVKAELKPLHESLGAISKEKIDFIETNLGWVWRDSKVYRGPRYATIRLVLNRTITDTKNLRADVQKATDEILAGFKSDKISEVTAKTSVRGSQDRRVNLATIEIKGRDERLFKDAEKEVIAKVTASGFVKEFVAKDDTEMGPRKLSFNPSAVSMAQFGFSKNEMAFQIQALTGTVEIAQTRESGRWLNVYLAPNKILNPDEKALNQLAIQSPVHGGRVQLSQIGSWAATGYSEKISHKDGERVLSLDFRFDGEKTNEQVVRKELNTVLAGISAQFPQLDIKTIDANEQDKKGREWTLQVVLMAGILIYLILALTLRSWTQPIIVGLPIPFALIGVIWALKLHDLPLGLMTMIGLIGTMGVAVNDSIVMVHHINGLFKRKGDSASIVETIIEGAASRLRAISLTASCTLIGVFPTAYGIGGESGFTQPLAFSLGWGLLTSLLLTLFIIPAMLMIYEDIDSVWNKIKNRFKPKGTQIPKPNLIPKSPVDLTSSSSPML